MNKGWDKGEFFTEKSKFIKISMKLIVKCMLNYRVLKKVNIKIAYSIGLSYFWMKIRNNKHLFYLKNVSYFYMSVQEEEFGLLIFMN